MNTYMIKYFETPVDPVICRLWEVQHLGGFNHELNYETNPSIKINTNQQYLNLNKLYTLPDTFGKKYVPNPLLYYLDYGKLKYTFTLENLIDTMNTNETVIDDFSNFKFSECMKYTSLPNMIRLNIIDYLNNNGFTDSTNVDDLYAFTNLRFVNVGTTRNAIGCLDSIECIVNLCRAPGKRWMYDYSTQLCYYPKDTTMMPNDDKVLFVNDF